MHLSCWKKREVPLPLSRKDEVAFHEELVARVKTSRRKENTVSVIADIASTYNS